MSDENTNYAQFPDGSLRSEAADPYRYNGPHNTYSNNTQAGGSGFTPASQYTASSSRGGARSSGAGRGRGTFSPATQVEPGKQYASSYVVSNHVFWCLDSVIHDDCVCVGCGRTFKELSICGGAIPGSTAVSPTTNNGNSGCGKASSDAVVAAQRYDGTSTNPDKLRQWMTKRNDPNEKPYTKNSFMTNHLFHRIGGDNIGASVCLKCGTVNGVLGACAGFKNLP